MTDALLNPARQRGDALADVLLHQVMGDEVLRGRFHQALSLGGTRLWAFADEHAPELTAGIGALPAWAKRYWRTEAQALFAKRGGEILMLLGLYSLPYCYAAADGAAVLMATGRLAGNDSAHARLQETALFIQAVLAGSEEEARQACLQVRLIHAMVRYRLRQKGWDESQGLPVNQEDMAGTNLAFGYLTWKGLRLLGLPVSAAETEAYLGWFAILGTWLGVEEPLSPHTPAACAALAQAIERRQHRPSVQGKALTQALLAGFAQTEAPADFIEKAPGLMAALLGPEIAQVLALPPADEAYLTQLKTLNTLRTLVPAVDIWFPKPRQKPGAVGMRVE